MRVSLNPLTLSSFKGVAPEFKNKRGYTVTPIHAVPSQSDIDGALSAARSEKPNQGMNGEAFMWGQDLVVKRYKHKKDACNFDPKREIKAHDLMYEDGVDVPNCQKGLYAFETPDGETYFVSTRVQGETLTKKTTLSKDELGAIVHTMALLDRGIIKDGKLQRLMHYDLSKENIKTDGKNAGIYDFEYLGYDDLTEHLAFNSTDLEQWTFSPHLSDVGLLPSNLRTFEHRAFYSVISSSDNPGKLFEEYLKSKSKYYADLAEYHIDFYRKTGNEAILDLAEKEEDYGKFLEANFRDDDIKQAEARKIQGTRFIFDFLNVYRESNLSDFPKYVEDSKEFFAAKAKEAVIKGDSQRANYFLDGIKLFEVWEKAPTYMREKLEEDSSATKFKTLDEII